MKTIRVLVTELVHINDTGNNYQVLIRMSQGGVIEHEPFPRDLRGLVAALQLATEVCAGKFYPRRATLDFGDDQKLEGKHLALTSKGAQS